MSLLDMAQKAKEQASDSKDLAKLKILAKSLGMSVKIKDGEYRLNIPGGDEDSAYYTDDFSDAEATLKAMGKAMEEGSTATAKEIAGDVIPFTKKAQVTFTIGFMDGSKAPNKEVFNKVAQQAGHSLKFFLDPNEDEEDENLFYSSHPITLEETAIQSLREDLLDAIPGKRDPIDVMIFDKRGRQYGLDNKWYAETAAIETAAPLSGDKYTWYKYSAARGTKITNTSGKRTATLKSGSYFGVRSATTKNGKTRLVTQELGLTLVFSFEQADATKIINKGVKAAPGAVAKVIATIAKGSSYAPTAKVKPRGIGLKPAAAGRVASPSGKNLGADQKADEKLAKKAFLRVVGQLDGTKLSKGTIAWLKTAAKQAQKIDKTVVTGKPTEVLISKYMGKKAPKLKTKRVDKGNGNLKIADTMGKFIVSIAKSWAKNVTNWEDAELSFNDLADYVKLAIALTSGNTRAINSASNFDTDIRDQLPKAVWSWYNKNQVTKVN